MENWELLDRIQRFKHHLLNKKVFKCPHCDFTDKMDNIYVKSDTPLIFQVENKIVANATLSSHSVIMEMEPSTRELYFKRINSLKTKITYLEKLDRLTESQGWELKNLKHVLSETKKPDGFVAAKDSYDEWDDNELQHPSKIEDYARFKPVENKKDAFLRHYKKQRRKDKLEHPEWTIKEDGYKEGLYSDLKVEKLYCRACGKEIDKQLIKHQEPGYKPRICNICDPGKRRLSIQRL